MDEEFKIDCIKRFEQVVGEINLLKNEQSHIAEDLTWVKDKVECLIKKVTKLKVNNAVAKVKIGLWAWFVRISMVAIMGALITKLFELW